MRLLRIGERGAEPPACERDGPSFDARPVADDFDGGFLAEGDIDTAAADDVIAGYPGDVVEPEIDGLGRQRQVMGEA